MRHILHTILQRILRPLLTDGVLYMADDTASANLLYVLKQRSEKVNMPRSTVLFRRGDKASGMFVVFSGKVSLDLGVDSAVGRTCGPGALVGLPSTLTRHNYSMTATVTEDAELGFWSPDALDSLLRNRPDLCQPLLAILGEKIAENHEVERAFLIMERHSMSNNLAESTARLEELLKQTMKETDPVKYDELGSEIRRILAERERLKKQISPQ